MANLGSFTVVLTGAGGFLATAIAQELEDAGAQMILVGQGTDLQEAADRFPAQEVIDIDLSDPASVQELQKLKADTLIHTVGGFIKGNAEQATSEQMQQMLDINFVSLFHAVQGVLPYMLQQKDGLIMGVSAEQVARKDGIHTAIYTASKAAVAGYLYALQSELKTKGIRSCVLYPMGVLDTTDNRDAGLNWDSMIDPRGVAKSVAHILTRPDRAHITELQIFPSTEPTEANLQSLEESGPTSDSN